MKSKKNIILFLNQNIGLKVLMFCSRTDNIIFAVVKKKNNFFYLETITFLKNNKIQYSINEKFFENKNNLKKISDIDFIITVYWPHFIKSNFLEKSKSSLNFHPSFLPFNRGWYPHVHNIINGSKAGVSLHQLSNKFDNGNIWSQKKVIVKIEDNASTLHERLGKEIFSLFKRKWSDIKNGKIKPTKQLRFLKFNSKKDIDKFDEIDLYKKYKAIDLIKKISARNFYDKSFSFFKFGGKKYKLHIKVSKS